MTAARHARTALVAALLALVLLAPACSAPPPGRETAAPTTSPPATEEAAVRGLLEKMNDAWARGDAAAYASYHTPDAHLIDFRGVHARGRQEIVELLQPAFDTVLAGTRVEARIVDLRFLSPDVALFHTEGLIVPTGAQSVQTFVVTRTAGEWAVAAFQNTRIQPAP